MLSCERSQESMKYSMRKITVSRCMYMRQVLLHQVTCVFGVAKRESG